MKYKPAVLWRIAIIGYKGLQAHNASVRKEQKSSSMSSNVRLLEIQRAKANRDSFAFVVDARAEGKAEGRAEGLAEGMKKSL